MRRLFGFLLFAALATSPATTVGEDLLYSHGSRAAEETKPGPPRQFAPSRKVDVLHLKLDVTPNFRTRTVSGTATLTFKPIAKALKTLRLDQVDLNIHQVTGSHAIEGYDVTDDALVVTFSVPIPAEETASVNVKYDAEPKKGLYFRTRELGYAAEDEHVWTQGETHEARHWYPSFDYPNERFTSEVISHVPKAMTVLSNGTELLSEVDASGMRTSHWKQSKPHVNYLIALVAGPMKKVSGMYKEIPLGLYTQPSDIGEAQNTWSDLEEMMDFFEKEIGVPYPWDQYNQVTIYDPHFGGMENTTLTTLTTNTLHRPEQTENLRSSRGLIAHELAHQWFGDYVTCKDWSHIWLNEGFATYYDALHQRFVDGEEVFLYTMLRRSDSITGRKDRIPMVQRAYKNPNSQFSYRAYAKGSWILHMLRSQLGEDLYRVCIKTYLERHGLKSVVTEDLNRILEELSGRSFDPFFDQWVYHARQPELEVSYKWDEAKKLANVTVAQTQKVDDDVLLFSFPTVIRFSGEGWVTNHDIQVSEASHDFQVSLEAKPTSVRFDPELTVLAKVTFKKPKEMLYTELEADDVLSRLLAARQLGEQKDKKTVGILKAALNGDSFYGVRGRASEALGKIGTVDALNALSGSLKQSDARVRNQIVRDLGKFYHPVARKALKQVVATEKNPMILRWALRHFAKYRGQDAKQAITTSLRSVTYRDYQAYYAQESVPVLDDPSLTGDLMKFLSRKERRISQGWYGNTLVTLGRLNRNEKNKDRVRTFIVDKTSHPNDRVKRGAIRALGLLEDTKAIPVVQSFTGGGDNKTSVQKAADEALKKLRATKKVSVELKDLTSEVMKLKEKNEKLEKGLEDLRKQIEKKESVDESSEKSETQGSD
jgi:aminopeptidase N